MLITRNPHGIAAIAMLVFRLLLAVSVQPCGLTTPLLETLAMTRVLSSTATWTLRNIHSSSAGILQEKCICIPFHTGAGTAPFNVTSNTFPQTANLFCPHALVFQLADTEGLQYLFMAPTLHQMDTQEKQEAKETHSPTCQTQGEDRNKTRLDKSRQNLTRLDKTRQDKTRQDRTRRDETRQDKKERERERTNGPDSL